MSTDDYLARLEALAAAATEGPWWTTWNFSAVSVRAHAAAARLGWTAVAQVARNHAADTADATFIAESRTAVPRLVAALRAVEAVCGDRERRVFLSRRTSYGEHTDYGDPLIHVNDIRTALGALTEGDERG